MTRFVPTKRKCKIVSMGYLDKLSL